MKKGEKMNIVTNIKMTTAAHIGLSKKFVGLLDRNIKEAMFSFGDWSEQVPIVFKEELPEDTIELPAAWNKKFTIPDLFYEVNIKANVIKLGPIICFIPSRTQSELIKSLQNYKPYYENYKHLNGLIFLSASTSIDIKNQRIHGFYYDSLKGTWEKGIFPIPDVLFRRVPISQRTHRFLIRKLGKRMFNTPTLSKWMVWKQLATNEQLFEHLPPTNILTKGHLDQMLKQYGEVHIKPVNGYFAIGIYKINKQSDKYRLRSWNGITKLLSEKEIFLFLKNKRSYIVQKSVITDQSENRNIVLRAILQKDKLKQWQCSGSYVRIGKEDSIATNRHLTDTFSTISNIFKDHYHLSDDQSALKEQELFELCIKACQVLEQKGNYADVAIDIMMDVHHNFWILEINHRRHNHLSPLQTVKDKDMYDKVLRTPFEYAKSLAGFHPN